MQALITILTGVFVYALVLSMTSKKTLHREKIHDRVTGLEKKNIRNRLFEEDEMSKPFAERVLKPLGNMFVQSVSKILPAGEEQSNEKMKKVLQQAGWSITVNDYNAILLACVLGGAGLGALLAFSMELALTQLILYIVIGAYAGSAILRFVVTSAGTKRRKALERQLPDMLDLLSVSVEAGLGFEQALFEITQNMDGPLIDEIAVTYREMSMGRPRREALILLGERCNTDDVKSFTGALVQAGQLGISIKNVLQSQSVALRRTRRNRIQEEAAKLSTKILFPMLVFIFPVLFIVLLGPAFLNIMETLG